MYVNNSEKYNEPYVFRLLRIRPCLFCARPYVNKRYIQQTHGVRSASFAEDRDLNG
jgi:hypothetical protein